MGDRYNLLRRCVKNIGDRHFLNMGTEDPFIRLYCDQFKRFYQEVDDLKSTLTEPNQLDNYFDDARFFFENYELIKNDWKRHLTKPQLDALWNDWLGIYEIVIYRYYLDVDSDEFEMKLGREKVYLDRERRAKDDVKRAGKYREPIKTGLALEMQEHPRLIIRPRRNLSG